MTPREKILRDALENLSNALDGIHIAEPMKKMADKALKQAKEIKYGPPSMTPREETQLAALEEIRCPNVREQMPGVWDLADETIEKCKEIKDGPSEEDETIVLNNASHLLEGGTLSVDRQKWMTIKLKQYMGIE